MSLGGGKGWGEETERPKAHLGDEKAGREVGRASRTMSRELRAKKCGQREKRAVLGTDEHAG